METPTTAYGKFELDLPSNVDYEEIKSLFDSLQHDVEGFDDIVLNAIETVGHTNERTTEETNPSTRQQPNPSSSSVSDGASVTKMDETTQKRFKQLDENALDEMEKEVYSMATKKNTKWGIGVFNGMNNKQLNVIITHPKKIY